MRVLFFVIALLAFFATDRAYSRLNEEGLRSSAKAAKFCESLAKASRSSQLKAKYVSECVADKAACKEALRSVKAARKTWNEKFFNGCEPLEKHAKGECAGYYNYDTCANCMGSLGIEVSLCDNFKQYERADLGTHVN